MEAAKLLPAITGTLSVLGGFMLYRSVVVATLAGAIVYGVAIWLIG